MEIFASFEEVKNSRALESIVALYQELLKNAKTERDELYKKPHIRLLEEKITENMIDIRGHEILEHLKESGIISPKTASRIESRYL